MSLSIYAAGPFFNTEQTDLIDNIVQIAETAGHKVWAPQRDGILCPKDATSEDRQKVFELDVDRIGESTCMIAVLDYLGTSLYREAGGKMIPVYLPDPGTIFEVGAAYIQRIPIIGITTRDSGFNLMITESLHVLLHGLENLAGALDLVDKMQAAKTSEEAIECSYKLRKLGKSARLEE